MNLVRITFHATESYKKASKIHFHDEDVFFRDARGSGFRNSTSMSKLLQRGMRFRVQI